MHKIANTTKFALILLIIGSLSISACSQPRKYSQNSTKSDVISVAKKLLGTRYRYGGNSPMTGFDCSGLVHFSHKQAGITVPRTTGQQYKKAMRVSRHALVPGDLVFFNTKRDRYVSHVGIYLGNDKFIHAPSSGKRVTINSLTNKYWKKHFASGGRLF